MKKPMSNRDRILDLALTLMNEEGAEAANTTRIAAADPSVWAEIFLANREAVRANLEAFRLALADLERAIAMGSGDALRAMLERIKTAREGLR